MHEYVGAIHIHSNYSDGLRPIPEIAEIAAQCSLDYLMFADHMTLEPLKAGMERWFGPVLSIIGYEINDSDNRNHYLVYGLDDILPPQLPAKEYVAQVKRLGGMGFIAHPDEKRTAMPELPPYPWTDWDVTGYSGIEIWNHSSEWLEKITHTNKYLRVLHPLKYLQGPEPETLERWDRLNREKAVVGIGGIDAHAYPYRLGPLTIYIFRYKVLFKGIRTHVLLDSPIPGSVTEARNALLDAIKHACCFISNHRWGDARGFRFEGYSDGMEYRMGDTVPGAHAAFTINAPDVGTIELYRDGKLAALSQGTDMIFEAREPGAYRVVVRRKKKPWIFSNHIRIRGVSD